MRKKIYLHDKIKAFADHIAADECTAAEEASLPYAVAVFYKKHMNIAAEKVSADESDLHKMFNIFADIAGEDDFSGIEDYWDKAKRKSKYWEIHYFLGECYLNGYGTARNIDSARDHFQYAVYSVLLDKTESGGIPLLDFKKGENGFAQPFVSSDWVCDDINLDYLVGVILEGIIFHADVNDDERHNELAAELLAKTEALSKALEKENEWKKLSKQLAQTNEENKKLKDDAEKLNKDTERLQANLSKIVKDLNFYKQELSTYKAKEAAEKAECERLEKERFNTELHPYAKISETIICTETAIDVNLFEKYGMLRFGEVVQDGINMPRRNSRVKINPTDKSDAPWLILEVTKWPEKNVGETLIFPNPLVLDPRTFGANYMDLYEISGEKQKFADEHEYPYFYTVVTPCVIDRRRVTGISKGNIKLL